ncbi:MAG: SusD/RagB family nutrient-binding outer membrane lipoprotein [Bacteroidales bacterium]|jgi:hypothetical protein|nr:SusD/RagB family nutrient-binding outer membrane lipoprotein [Bacteroidales bacterium]MCI1785095.1 SusD/RagB family nutrient-binding outer membrane lipoprotein [Bacteroidales bacterium]
MKKIIYIILLASSVFGLASCTNNFEDINTNPNKINYGQIESYNCFEPILYGAGYYQQDFALYYNNELIQMTAFTGGATSQIHQYYITSGNWQSIWDNYARYGGDCQHMIDLAVEEKEKFYESVGLIMKVYNLANLTSIFGDIPYSEAYQYSNNLTPKFDTQEEVLTEMLADLDSASTMLAEGVTPSRSGLDLMYNDSPAKWRKLANSMRMRLLCRFSGVSDTYWAEIQNMIDNPDKYPVMTSNDDNADVPFQDVDPYMSYWGQEKMTESSFAPHRLTERVISMMAQLDDNGNALLVDPRLPIYGHQRGGKWKGTIAGCSTADYETADDGTAYPNYSIICRASFPAFLMDYSEILFIEAEGVVKGKLTIPGETAKSLYEAAVNASMDKWSALGATADTPKTIRSTDVTKFMASSLGSYDMAAAENGSSIYSSPEELILSQKYISLYWCGFEQYDEWRRTEYPVLTIGNGTEANNYELPTRFGYPNYTESSNGVNFSEAITRMGGTEDDMHLALDWSYKKLNGGTHRNPYVAQ